MTLVTLFYYMIEILLKYIRNANIIFLFYRFGTVTNKVGWVYLSAFEKTRWQKACKLPDYPKEVPIESIADCYGKGQTRLWDLHGTSQCNQKSENEQPKGLICTQK